MAGGDKRRDGYGQEPGTTQFQTHEGGLIFCFPDAGGVIYSNENTRPFSIEVGGGRADPPAAAGKFHFPVRGNRDAIPVPGTTPGTLRIVAFDHKYTDNSGVYEVVFTITREPPD